MRNIFLFSLFFLISTSLCAQINIEYLDEVPAAFKEKYDRQDYTFNPLHVGDFWQYSKPNGDYAEKIVTNDTIVNGRKYFKKIDFYKKSQFEDYLFTWERNDTLKEASYLLDIEDLDNDSSYSDELLLDSLKKSNINTSYLSYRYTWEGFYYGPYNTRIYDTSWVIVFNDTVRSRTIEYLEFFHQEVVVEKYGIIAIYPEQSPPTILTGAIINGEKYGNIVGVNEENSDKISSYITMNNYPNPFNPSTKIIFNITKSDLVKIKIFNVLGKEIKAIVSKFFQAGEHEVIFNGEDFPSGIYFAVLSTNNQITVHKICLLK